MRAGFEQFTKSVATGLIAPIIGFGLSADTVDPLAINPCVAPTQAEFAEVQSLFDAPPIGTDYRSIEGLGETEAAFQYRRAALGRMFGVTLPDTSLVDASDYFHSESTPFSAYFDNGQRLLAGFGITLSVAKPGEDGLRADQIPTADDLENTLAKHQVQLIDAGFASLPKEFFALAGTKRILLAKNTGSVAFAYTDGRHDTIVADVGAVAPSTSLFVHEVFHEVDSVMCGGSKGMHDDPAFRALNGGQDVYNPTTRGQWITVDRVRRDIAKLAQDKLSNEKPHDKLCEEQQAVNDELPKVVANTDYGLTDVAEDKADTGKELAFPSAYGEVMDPNIPAVKRKFEFLLTRLYHRHPQVVRYLAAVSGRNDSTPKDMIMDDC